MKTYLKPSVDFSFIEADDVISTSGPVVAGGAYENDNNKGIGYNDLF